MANDNSKRSLKMMLAGAGLGLVQATTAVQASNGIENYVDFNQQRPASSMMQVTEPASVPALHSMGRDVFTMGKRMNEMLRQHGYSDYRQGMGDEIVQDYVAQNRDYLAQEYPQGRNPFVAVQFHYEQAEASYCHAKNDLRAAERGDFEALENLRGYDDVVGSLNKFTAHAFEMEEIIERYNAFNGDKSFETTLSREVRGQKQGLQIECER